MIHVEVSLERKLYESYCLLNGNISLREMQYNPKNLEDFNFENPHTHYAELHTFKHRRKQHNNLEQH